MDTRSAAPSTSPGGEPPPRPDPGWGPTAVKIGVPIVVLGGLTVLDPGAMRAVVTATVGSPRALLIVAGVVAAIVGWSALLRRFVPNPWAQAGLVLAPLALVFGLWIAPYFGGDEVVDDEFPVALADAPTASDEPVPADNGVGETADATATAEEVLADPADTQSGAGPTPAGDPATPPDLASESAPQTAAGGLDQAAPPEPVEEPAGPVELSRGTFVGLDNHFANGQAALYDLGDGSTLVRLEEVDLQPVPAPVVYLVPGADATAPTADSVNLGVLKGNMGNQNYDVPAEVDVVGGTWTVLVWCETFASPVGAASQT